MDGETKTRVKLFTEIHTVLVLRAHLTPGISTEINLQVCMHHLDHMCLNR